MNEMISPAAAVKSEEHWTTKDGGVKLFLFEKYARDPAKTDGTILFVHGSSMASQPTFDLQVPGRTDSSAMDHFARRGYDCWSVDMEGYGLSTKDRDNNAPISQGADDCYAAALYIQKLRGKRPFFGLWDFLRRVARGDICRAAPGDGGETRARCHGLDRRRFPHARAAAQEARRVQSDKPATDRQGVHSLGVRPRPPRYGRTPR